MRIDIRRDAPINLNRRYKKAPLGTRVKRKLSAWMRRKTRRKLTQADRMLAEAMVTHFKDNRDRWKTMDNETFVNKIIKFTE